MVIRHTGENLKMKYLKEDYPKNLLLVIQLTAVYTTELPTEDITEDIKAGLDYALSTLAEREQTIIRMRYQEHLSLREIGIEIGVTTERIRSLSDKILRKLREPQRLGYIKFGKCGYEALIAKREEEKRNAKVDSQLQMTLEELDLTVRSFNCLKVRGCDTVGDIAALTEEEILQTKNLGKKSMIEIAEALKAIGVYNTAWDEFIE